MAFGNENLKLELSPTPGKVVIALSYIFTGIYGLMWAPTGWIYCSEVFPLKYRAKGVGLSAATNWAFNFALACFLPPAFRNITWKTYIIFGIFCFVMIFHIFFTYPETARESLEEINLIFDSKIPAWKSAKVHSDALQTRAAKIENGETYGEMGLSMEKDKEGDVHRKEVV
ncbi:hypothetical protein BST61_g8685 [Cercospora zeina]